MSAFEGWAVVEILGHRVRYGQVSEVTAFGEPFCRIDLPTEPPTFELYAGRSIYGLRPASEATIRAYHAPRRALTTGERVVDDGDWDSVDEPDEPQCAFCAQPLGDEPTERVDSGPDSDVEVWHARCVHERAEISSDAIDHGELGAGDA